MILIIDNYDSFSYNLYQYVGSINPDVVVVKNDAIDIKGIKDKKVSHIIISPGPGRPANAGICIDVIRAFSGQIPILGVCLGHQAVCEVFGGVVTYAKELVHGKKWPVQIANGSPLFRGLPPIIEAGRYHSLCVLRDSIPDTLLVIAETHDGEIMGVKHRDADTFGVQFHPESILTENGMLIIENFLALGGN